MSAHYEFCFALNFMKSLKQVQKRSLILADKPRLLPSIPFRLVGNKVYTNKKLHIYSRTSSFINRVPVSP